MVWSKFFPWAAGCSITICSVLSFGQEVERPPIEIFPPEESTAESPAKLAKPLRDELDIGIMAPFRLKLELPTEFDWPDPDPQPALTEEQAIAKRIDDYLLAQAAFRRAQTGAVHPGWRNISRRIEHYLEPHSDQIHDSTSEVSWAWMRKITWDWLENWYQSAGNAINAVPFDAELDPHRPIDTPLFALQQESAYNPGYGTTFTTLIEVSIDKNGSISTRLVGSSGQRGFDTEALRATRNALIAPLRQELPDKDGRALYAVSARVAIVPPLPVVGLGFDLMLGKAELFYPFKKFIQGRVKMLALF